MIGGAIGGNSSQPLTRNMAAAFVLVTDEELGDLIDSADSANTKNRFNTLSADWKRMQCLLVRL